MQQKVWDVIVVGSGSGGSVAANDICVDAGLETLLLEKKVFPRDKVCTGIYFN